MNNFNITELYDKYVTYDNGTTKLDEQKLKRAIDENNGLFSSNKEAFKSEPRSKTCQEYNPCPICHKCKNKASNMYIRCKNCTIPVCVHTYKDICNMIRRENFAVKVSNKTSQLLKEMIKNAVVKE